MPHTAVSGTRKLPFAGYSVDSALARIASFGEIKFFDIVWGDPPSRRRALRWASRFTGLPAGARESERRGDPRPHQIAFPGGHRSRVTPVPIPNTEVKPATADGTAWETAWESRSLPAVLRTKTPDVSRAFLCTARLRSAAKVKLQEPEHLPDNLSRLLAG